MVHARAAHFVEHHETPSSPTVSGLALSHTYPVEGESVSLVFPFEINFEDLDAGYARLYCRRCSRGGPPKPLCSGVSSSLEGGLPVVGFLRLH